MPSNETKWRATPELFVLQCPDCGGAPDYTIEITSEPSYSCSDCRTVWDADSIDDCQRCGKPLGSTDILCYTCQTEIAGE